MKSLRNYTRNLLPFLRLAWKMFNANNIYGYYHWYVSRVAGATIKQSRFLNDGTIPDRTYKKVRWYMVEAVIMGEMLARLTDKSIAKRDRESLVFLGAIMALFDVIVDDFRLDRAAVIKILENTFSPVRLDKVSAYSAIERIYYLYLDKLIVTIEKEHWYEISQHLNIIKLQIDSDEQFRENTPEESVKQLTIGKGGVSVLICSAFLNQKNEQFRKAIFELGGLIQMMNDCQDIHKDAVEGIKTFVHFRKDFRGIFDKLDEQRKKSFHLIKTLEYSFSGRRKTLFELNAMFIVIAFKLQEYAKACNYILDFKSIAAMGKKDFRIDPFSPKAISACFNRILKFDFENYESTPGFKFEQADHSI